MKLIDHIRSECYCGRPESYKGTRCFSCPLRKENMYTTVLSFYAGPGCGKSTSSAFIFAELKRRGVNSELVREYIKDWVWEGRNINVYDQFYFLGKQIRKESLVLGKVDAIVTDCPVWLSAYYSERISPPLIRNGVEACVQGYYQQAKIEGHRHINIWLNRSKPFVQAGRWHTEEQSREVDVELKLFLQKRGVELVEAESDFDSLSKVLDELGFY